MVKCDIICSCCLFFFFVCAFKMKVVVPLNNMHANEITFKVEKSNKKSSKNIKNLK